MATAAPPDGRCQVIANVFQKGGTGKTFTSTNEAGGFNARGYDVLLVDMDPQGSLTANLELQDIFNDPGRTSLDEILLKPSMWGQIHEVVHSLPEFDFVPSNKTFTGNRSPLDSADNSGERMKLVIEEELAEEYDFVVFDTPPSFDAYTKNAILAAGQVVVPVKPEYEMIHSTKLLRDMLQTFERVNQIDIEYLAFLMGNVDYSSISKQDRRMVEWFHDTFQEKGYEIRQRAAFARAKYQNLRDESNPGHSIYTYAEARACDQFEPWDEFVAELEQKTAGTRTTVHDRAPAYAENSAFSGG